MLAAPSAPPEVREEKKSVPKQRTRHRRTQSATFDTNFIYNSKRVAVAIKELQAEQMALAAAVGQRKANLKGKGGEGGDEGPSC